MVSGNHERERCSSPLIRDPRAHGGMRRARVVSLSLQVVLKSLLVLAGIVPQTGQPSPAGCIGMGERFRSPARCV